MINVGDKLPEATLSLLTYEGMESPTTADLFANKTVVLFALPGAFTPTCSESHLPGYVVLADQFKAKGVDSIICLSVNDAFVMQAWGEMQNANELIMLADGDGSFTRALGLGYETGSFGGYRSSRYAMIVKDGVVTQLNVEPEESFGASSAETMLELV